jgi:uncharacterized protein (DUF427 family)
MPAIRHHYVEIDGLKVFVREAGDAARPTLVLLPGYPSSIRLIDRLSPNWHTVAIDYPGFGSSDPLPEPPTFDRIDIRQTSRHLAVRSQGRVIADTPSPLVLFESGFAPRWYVPRSDVDESTLIPVKGQTFFPYKGLANYYEIDGRRGAAWSYKNAWAEVSQIGGFISFEADKVNVSLDDKQLKPQQGQTLIAHGVDRDLTVAELERKGEL